MKTLAPHDRPREKLQRLGVPALGDNELLAIVLGQGSRRASALDLANAVLNAFGGIHGLVRAGRDAVTRLPGIGAARSAQILAALELGRRTMTRLEKERVQFTSPRIAAEYLLPHYGNRPVEHFGIVLLDVKLRVLRTSLLSSGTVDTAVIQPRDVFREAALGGAAALVLFHNHPSGDPKPSDDDVRLTARMVSAGFLMGIHVMDHVILSDVRYYSFKEERTLPFGSDALR